MFEKYNVNLEERKNLRLIDGKGKSKTQIVDEYQNLINGEFNLTVNEIVDILSVSKDYWQKKLSDKVEHIIITTTVRTMLLSSAENDISKELLYKRVLYNRSSFEDMIKKEFKKKSRAMVINLLTLAEKYEYIHSNYVSIQDFLNIYNNQLSPIFKEVDIDNCLPEKYMSITKINEIFGFNYNIQGYRYVNENYLSKYVFDKNVRYNLEEYNKKRCLYIPYSYIEFKLLEQSKLDKILDFIKNDHIRYIERKNI